MPWPLSPNLMRYLVTAALLVTAFIVSHSAQAQSARDASDNAPLTRHRVTLSVGLLPQLDTEPGSARINSYLGALAYANRVAADWEAEVAAALHGVEATAGESATVISLLIGINYYPPALALTSAVRPYLTGSVGPYVGSSADGFAGRTRTETVVGTRFGGGVDVRLARWLHGGLRAAYHVAPNYSEPVGSITTPRGAQLSLELGVTFGGR